jgi:hypothetical protein
MLLKFLGQERKKSKAAALIMEESQLPLVGAHDLPVEQ